MIPLVVSGVAPVPARRCATSYRDIRTRLARINAYLQERITGMRVVQLFGREADEAERFDALNRGHLDANLESITYYALYFPAIELLTSIALASLIVAGAHRVEIGTLTVGTVAAFLQLCGGSFSRCRTCPTSSTRCSRRWRRRSACSGCSTRAGGAALADRETASVAPRGRRATAPRGVTIEFEDVWFAYDSATSPRGGQPRRRSGCSRA